MSDLQAVARQFRVGSLSRDAAQLTDGQLLENFVLNRDPDAFAALLQLHGPMVYASCLRILRNHHDAGDAFQSTFLVLARSATIDPQPQLDRWLVEPVALRSHRSKPEKSQASDPYANSRSRELMRLMPRLNNSVWNELEPILDEELANFRRPTASRSCYAIWKGCHIAKRRRRSAALNRRFPCGCSEAEMHLPKKLSRRGVVLSVASLSGPALRELCFGGSADHSCCFHKLAGGRLAD